jgi:hypothetical protein
MRRFLLPSSCLLLPLLLLFFWKIAFTNLILARGDTFLYFYPYWDYRAQVLLSGHLPLWNPYLFMGAPFLANSQAGVFYPLNWPLVVFPAPVAVKIALVVHLLIAALGAHRFARALGQSAAGALLSAALFALGGYLTAQVEHINQLQGLAWFPWLMVVLHLSLAARRSSTVTRHLPRLAVILALQLLAGHTQSTFISLVGAFIYFLILRFYRLKLESWKLNLSLRDLLLPASFLLALLLSAAQLLPTLELSQHSLRGGGLALRDALSFSLHPRLLGRALLPGYSRPLFSEFVAYPGMMGLALMWVGVKREPKRTALLALAGIGVLFALGAFDPAYALLATFPPFNFFRAPARWLFLFAFGVALLAGHGLDELKIRRPSLFLSLSLYLFPLALLALTPLANAFTPAGETGPLGAPQWVDWLGWLLPLVALAFVSFISRQWRAPVMLTLALVELFSAAQVLPYNHLTALDAYTSVRPAMTQLLIIEDSRNGAKGANNPLPPPRFLSMSALRFDPGDLAELHSELDAQLAGEAVYDFIVATKHKEVLSHNLPLAWGVMAVDGFDGGLLPLRHYADFTALFTGAVSTDGRLSESLTIAPDPRLLALVNAEHLITDKVDDAWVDDVFYDLQFTLTLGEGEHTTIARVPHFTATALGLVMESPSGSVEITFADGSITSFPITSPRVSFAAPAAPITITLAGPLTVRGLSLIDERSGVFQSLTLGPYRLAHSGDVKIYELLAVLPRAVVAPAAVVISDTAAAQTLLADPTFDPATTVILAEAVDVSPGEYTSGEHVAGEHTGSPLRATIVDYGAEYVRITAEGPGYLLLTDADYPGWRATVDGAPAPIVRADLMFRAVVLPAGKHVVEFRYEPLSVRVGLWISGVVWGGLGLLWLWRQVSRRRKN